MKSVKWTIIGLVIGMVVFTFIPTSHSAKSVVEGFQAANSSYLNVSYQSAYMISPYMIQGTLDENSEASKTVTTAFTSTDITEYIYELCTYDDPYVPGVFAHSYINPGNEYGKYRWNYHGGDDLLLADPGGSHGDLRWTLAMFSGIVRESYYHASWGRTVVVESDAVPGLYVRYAHLGPGDCTTTPGSPGRGGAQNTLKYPNGEPIANYIYGSGMQTVSQYERDEGFYGHGDRSSTWAGGLVQVKVGDHVNVGDRIGIMGTTGNSTGYHSHIEMYLDIDTATGELRPFSGTVPFSCYRCSPQAVLDARSFANVTWLFYVNANTKPGNPIDYASIVQLQEFEKHNDPATDENVGGGGGDEDEGG